MIHLRDTFLPGSICGLPLRAIADRGDELTNDATACQCRDCLADAPLPDDSTARAAA